MKKWDDTLWLVTLTEFNSLPKGIKLISINLKELTVENIAKYGSLDTRAGLTAWGLTEDLAKQQNFHEQFLLMIISS